MARLKEEHRVEIARIQRELDTAKVRCFPPFFLDRPNYRRPPARPTRRRLSQSDLRRAEGERTRLRDDLSRLKAYENMINRAVKPAGAVGGEARPDPGQSSAFPAAVLLTRPHPPHVGTVRDSFMSCDKDGSGDIDYKELKKALKGTGVRGDAAPAVMQKHDKDSKGSLTIMEFNNMVQDMLDA